MANDTHQRRRELQGIRDEQGVHITAEDKDRFFFLLEQLVNAVSYTIPEQAPTNGKPVHSGHKGGEFMHEARTEFKERFQSPGLPWSSVNKWITLVFGIASKAGEGASADDMTWLYQTLSTSLQNGFAFVIKEMED